MKKITTEKLMAQMGSVFLSYRRTLQKKLLPYKCTLKQHYVLSALTKREYLLPSEIAEKLYCDRPTASVIIRNLEKYGWISKEQDPEDRRNYLIRITDRGRRIIERTKSAVQPDINPFEGFSKKEKKELLKMFKRMKKNITT